jgi:hypothetical protein
MKTRRQIRAKLAATQQQIEKWTKEYENGNITEKDYNQAIDVFTIREDILEWVLEKEAANND